MRRGSKRTPINPAKTEKAGEKPSRLTHEVVARIRDRREQIFQREGLLSDSAALIREDRDR